MEEKQYKAMDELALNIPIIAEALAGIERHLSVLVAIEEEKLKRADKEREREEEKKGYKIF